MNATKITVNLSDEMDQTLTTYCAEFGCSKSRLIQKALTTYFADMKNIEITFSTSFNQTDRNFILEGIKNKINTLV